jgi:hypothetical protein
MLDKIRGFLGPRRVKLLEFRASFDFNRAYITGMNDRAYSADKLLTAAYLTRESHALLLDHRGPL